MPLTILLQKGTELHTGGSPSARTGEPGEATHHGSSQLCTAHMLCRSSATNRAVLATSACAHNQNTLQSISLSFFIAKQRTVFEAGFALKTQGSLVKGFTPLRAFVAGLFFSFMLSIPASLKEPFFFT